MGLGPTPTDVSGKLTFETSFGNFTVSVRIP
jgi:hypothetical protein